MIIFLDSCFCIKTSLYLFCLVSKNSILIYIIHLVLFIINYFCDNISFLVLDSRFPFSILVHVQPRSRPCFQLPKINTKPISRPQSLTLFLLLVSVSCLFPRRLFSTNIFSSQLSNIL